MSEREPRRLADLFEQIRFYLQEPLDFTRTEPETIAAKVRLLVAAAAYFNTLAVADYGGRKGTARDPGLVE